MELFPLVRDQFPSYEILWRRYIVPLTNRIHPEFSFPAGRDHWIRLRDDVPGAWVTWAMHHYSVFYYFARAVQRLRSKEYIYPEDVFSLLDSCCDNVREFFLQTKQLIKRVGGSVPHLPTQKKDMYLEKAPGQKTKEGERGCFVEVQRYRDVILHNPVIGRAVDVSRELLPRREVLDRVKGSWREAARLRPTELIDSKDLFDRLKSEISDFLEFHWKQIISAFDAVRESAVFQKELGLTIFSWPASLEEFGSTAQPVGASGTNKLPANRALKVSGESQMALNDLELRPATVADEAFANNLLFETMHRYVEATWPEAADQQRYYRINPFNPSNTWIIQLEKKDVGRLSKTVRDDCIFIDELHIVPDCQRMGVGRQILEGILAEARERHIRVKLTVLKVNCAQNLYLRMGFKVAEEKEHRLHMEWMPR